MTTAEMAAQTFHPECRPRIARACAGVRFDGKSRTLVVRAHSSFQPKWGVPYVYRDLRAVFGQVDGPSFADNDWTRITVTFSKRG